MTGIDISRHDAMEDPPPAVQHEYDAETPPSIAVVQAVCALEDIDPMEMDSKTGFVLREHIDPTALDTLLADSTGEGTTVITFEIVADNTHLVDICDDGQIIVRHAITA